MKILIIDDSQILRKRIIGIISDIPGVEICGEAGSSTEAIKLLNEMDPEVIIMDIRMPDGSGIEVLKNIRKQKISVITIILTNYPLIQYREKCMELGADYFFDKSSDIDKMADVIKQLLIKVQ